MKKIYAILVLITLSLTALAQGGRELYSKYSDLPGMEAVYISPAMFRMIGKIPDVELGDEDINFSSIIKSMTGFYILNTENPQDAAALLADVNKFIKAGKFELLMEAKNDGEATRMYTIGDEKTVTSFVMVSQEKDEVSFISFDGKMDREKMGEMIAKSADKK
ncbi:MAG: DUF4252 domain-containing protein [Bacteroidales bacterium]|nr:DUF4252 domain-containing protein [Bacteroidales bacterium]MBR1783446.1 DUF4252 domain-containing protein [Bacteroidales bacterium]